MLQPVASTPMQLPFCPKQEAAHASAHPRTRAATYGAFAVSSTVLGARDTRMIKAILVLT